MHHLRRKLLVVALILTAAAEPPTVEVRAGGDDGLTQRLADAVRAAFANPPSYAPDSSGARLIVTIPTHVTWEDFGSRTKVTYTAELAIASAIAHHTGSCWENKMAVCARQIVEAAATLQSE